MAGADESFPVGDYLSPTNGKETADALALAIAAPEEIDLFQFGYIGYVDSSMASGRRPRHREDPERRRQVRRCHAGVHRGRSSAT